MAVSKVGFAVIYRWRLHAGKENQFRRAWEAVTLGIKAERGGLGSRLHQADDGTWVAYAQWPDRNAWEKSQKLDAVDPVASTQMQEAIAESYPPLLLDPVCDRLV
jgi:quinol monooxygenase YgiN